MSDDQTMDALITQADTILTTLEQAMISEPQFLEGTAAYRTEDGTEFILTINGDTFKVRKV